MSSPTSRFPLCSVGLADRGGPARLGRGAPLVRGGLLSAALALGLGCDGALSVESSSAAVAGSASDRTEIVAIEDTDGFFCSGVAIGPREIVTARLCISEAVEASPCTELSIETSPPITPPLEIVELLLEREESTGTQSSHPLAVLRTAEPHGLPTLSLPEAAVAVGDTGTLVGFGRPAAGDAWGTRHELDVTVTEPLFEDFDFVFSAPAAACAGDAGGAVIAADGSTLLAVNVATGASVCGEPADSERDIHVSAFDRLAFLEAAIARPVPTECNVVIDTWGGGDEEPDAGPGDADGGDSAGGDGAESGGCRIGDTRATASNAWWLVLGLALAVARRRTRRNG